MRRPYDPGFDPPAPMVSVALRQREGRRLCSAPAKLDSGADLCGIPAGLVEMAQLQVERAARAAGFAGELTTVGVYRFDLEIDGRWIESVEGIATRRPYVIVGRNVLLHYVLRLDGPRARLDLTRPPGRARA